MTLPIGITIAVIAFIMMVALPCFIQRKRLWRYFKRECLFSCQGTEEEGGDDAVGHANEGRQDARPRRLTHQTNASAGHELQELNGQGRMRAAARREGGGTKAAGSNTNAVEGSSSRDE